MNKKTKTSQNCLEKITSNEYNNNNNFNKYMFLYIRKKKRVKMNYDNVWV